MSCLKCTKLSRRDDLDPIEANGLIAKSLDSLDD
jgi:hypothetical protein